MGHRSQESEQRGALARLETRGVERLATITSQMTKQQHAGPVARTGRRLLAVLRLADTIDEAVCRLETKRAHAEKDLALVRAQRRDLECRVAEFEHARFDASLRQAALATEKASTSRPYAGDTAAPKLRAEKTHFNNWISGRL